MRSCVLCKLRGEVVTKQREMSSLSREDFKETIEKNLLLEDPPLDLQEAFSLQSNYNAQTDSICN